MSRKSSFITELERYIVQTVPILYKAGTKVPLKPVFITLEETVARRPAPVHRRFAPLVCTDHTNFHQIVFL